MGLRVKIAAMVVVALAGLLALAGSLDLMLEKEGDYDIIYSQLRVLANSITKSLMHDMIEGDSAGIQKILESVATEPGIEAINIFAADGTVLRSSSRDRVGFKIDPEIMSNYREGKLRYIDEDTYGNPGVYRVIRPINNAPACYGCHDKTKEVVGVITLDYSLEGIQESIEKHRSRLTLSYLFAVLLGGTVIFAMLDRRVIRPIRKIRDAMDQAESGNMEVEVKENRRDELGTLAGGFNKMLSRIRELNEETFAQQRSQLLQEQGRKVRQALESQNKALEALNRDAAEKNRRYMEMLGFISEDMKSPLTLLRGYVDMLLGGELGGISEEQRDAVASMDRNLAQLQSMLANYTSLSNMEKGLVTPRKRGADLLSDVVKPTMVEFSGLLERSNMGLKVAADEDSVVFWMDPALMSSALGNLVSNAIRYGRPGSDIEIGVRMGDGEVEMSVYNEGRGIPASQLERIFDRFTRVEYGPEEGRGVRSAGLGLYIVSRIVAIHGGTVFAESSEGNWFKVTCRLPMGGVEE